MRTLSRRVRVGLAMSALVVLGGALSGCAADPPAEDVVTETFDVPGNRADKKGFDLLPEGTTDTAGGNWQSNVYGGGMPRPRQGEKIAVKSIRWKVLDAEGNEIPSSDHRIHMHHVVMHDSQQINNSCSTTSRNGRFAAPGGERTPLLLPAGYAYVSEATSRWTADWHIMNQSPVPMNGIRVTYEVTYTTNLDTLVPVNPYWIDTAGTTAGSDAGTCNAGQFNVPFGGTPTVYERTRRFKVKHTGLVLAVRTHMHAGAIDVTVRNGAGDEICRGVPRYEDAPGGAHEHGHTDSDLPPLSAILEVPLCQPENVAVYAGDDLLVSVRYNSDRPLNEVMGSALVYIG
jgi:hypothetical protein